MIEQLAPAGQFGVSAPLAIVAGSSAVAVLATDEEQRANCSVVAEYAGPLHGGMKAPRIPEAAATGQAADADQL